MYKLFSFSLFPRTLAFRQLDKGMGTSREQGLQGTHQRLSYVLVVFMQQVTNRFSPSDHLAEVSLLIWEGGAERKESWAPNSVQWRGAGDEMLWFSCTWALHTGNAAWVLGAIPGALGMMVLDTLAGRQGKRLGKHYREDCGLILSQKPGKTDLKSETTLLVRLISISEKSLPPEVPCEKNKPNICKST